MTEVFSYLVLLAGTCQSVGCTVDKCHPHDIIEKIDSGEYEVPDVSPFLRYSLKILKI